MLTDDEFVEVFFQLFRQLPPRREWISYDQWGAEKEKMIERMRSIIGEKERNA